MKQKFIQSTFILFVGGMITKLLGMVIKILMSRMIGLDGLSLYMLILPTFSFFISFAQAGFPISLSRLVAGDSLKTHTLYSTSIIFLFLFHILLMILLIFITPFISHTLLHNDSTYLPLLMISVVLPFTTLSSILRSYFIGRERMFPPVLSNIIENVLRLLFLLFLFPRISLFPISYLVSFLILSNILSEGISTLLLFFFLPKISFSISFSVEYLKRIFSISIPTFLGNLIGNITYFLEPILLTSISMFLKFPNNYILQEYGVLSGYVFPILFLPTFFTNALSQSFLPFMTREAEKKNYSSIISVFFLQLFIILLFSLFLLFVFLFFGDKLLSFLYHTSYGFSYLKILSPFLFFYYAQGTFQSVFLALGDGKVLFKISFFSSIVRILSLIILLFLGKGIYSLLFSFIFNVVFTTLFQFYLIFKRFLT